MVVIAARNSDFGKVEESNGRKNRIMRLRVIGMRKFKNKRNEKTIVRGTIAKEFWNGLDQWKYTMCCRRRKWNRTNTVPMIDNDTSSKIGVGSFNKLLTSGTELKFLKIAKWQLYTCRPTNILWVNFEIIDPLVPKDISRRGGLRSLPFSNRWVSVSQMTVERGGWKAKSAVYH